MNNQAKRCVETLAESIEEKEDGGWRYPSDSSTAYDYLMPILIENLDINPEGMLISKNRVRGDINDLLLDVQDEANPVSEFESRIGDISNRISDIDVSEYIITFPINFDSNSSELLPERLSFKDIDVERISFNSWTQDWVPNYEDPDGDRELMKLSTFLEKSPNDITNPRYTYWRASCYARDKSFAINHLGTALSTILGQLNFAMKYNRTQGKGIHSGPWPNRWSELRSPFIFLVYNEDEYENHFFPNGDASYRKPESPHSIHEDRFKQILDDLPSFESEQPLDSRLIESFNMFQLGITNPHYEQGFFEFWRGIEILASIDDNLESTNTDDAIAGIVERVANIHNWKDPNIAEIRLDRVSDKRNEYVHEAEYDSINRNDYNLTKSLLEGIIKFACDQRTEWSVRDWMYVLNNFETESETLERNQELYARKIDLLEEMKEFGDT